MHSVPHVALQSAAQVVCVVSSLPFTAGPQPMPATATLSPCASACRVPIIQSPYVASMLVYFATVCAAVSVPRVPII
jgi:hypothetical protein